MTVKERHEHVQSQLGWLEARGVIHRASVSEQKGTAYTITIHERGPLFAMSLHETECFISGAMTMHRWHERREATL